MLEEALNFAQGVLLTVILVRAFQLGTFRLYPFFYIYVSIVALWYAAALAGKFAWGINDWRYLALYVCGAIASKVAVGAFLLWVLSLPQGFSFRFLRPWGVFLIITVAAEVYLSSPGHDIWIFSRASSCFFFFVALQALYRWQSHILSFRMGRNMAVALGGCTFLLLLEFLNAGLYLSRTWGYEVFVGLFDFAGVAAWGLIAWGILDLDMPKRNQ